MQITKIQKLKNNKYNIIIDGEKITTFDNVILENNLLYKKVIDKVLYEKIVEDTKYFDIYNKTIKYILKRRRSEKEIREYLIKNGLIQIEDTIKRLKKNNLINDLEYCKAFINDSILLGKSGINKIKNELIKQGIDINIIEESLKNIDSSIFDNKLEKIIIKKIKANKKYSNMYLKQKILNELMNLGYTKDSIINILEENIIDDNNILDNEFDKIYFKLLKKYDGEELIKKVKIKLLSKGFKLEEINILIQRKTEK